jgi:hypothetical protein
MKIKNIQKNDKVFFDRINDGDAFIHQNELYMKIYSFTVINPIVGPYTLNAVNIADGTSIGFTDCSLVTKVDGYFTVESTCDKSPKIDPYEYDDPYEDWDAK